MLPPHTPEVNPANRGATTVNDPPRMYGSLVPMQFELPQVVNAPWTSPSSQAPGPLPPLTITVPGVLNSFRRRWWSVALGALVGAIALALAWVFVPPQNEVEAILELSRETTEMAGDRHQEMPKDVWESYKSTQATLVKTRLALMKSLDIKDKDTGRPLQELPIIRAEWDPVGWLQKKVRVWFPGDASIMVISMKGEDPQQMVKLINAVTETYIQEFTSTEKTRQTEELTKLNAHLLSLESEYEKAQNKYDLRSKQLGVLNTQELQFKHTQINAALQSLIHRRQEVISMLTDKKVEIIELRKRLQLAGTYEPSQTLIEEKLHENPKFHEKIAQREDYLRQYREKKSRVKDTDAPILKRIQASIDQVDNEIELLRDELAPQIRQSMGGEADQATKFQIEGAEDAIKLLQEDLAGLQESITKSEEQLNTLHTSTGVLDGMQNNLDSLRQRMAAVKTEILKAQLNLEAKAPITVYNLASVPESSMDWMRYMMVASLGGMAFCLPVLGLIAWDYKQRRLNSSGDLPESLGVKLVGAIPSLGGKKKKSKAKEGDAAVTGRNHLADAVDGVRTALMRDAAAESTRIVMVTSPVGREGKTTLATQLAASLGRAGRRTLLIDGDLRHPSAHRALGVAQEPGLAEILRNEIEIEEAIRPTRANGLWMIPSGKYCEEALHALARDGVQEVFKELSSGFDFVIIDAPPVLTDSDALVIGQHVDAAIISVLRDISRVPQLYDARDRLRTVGVRLLGCVYHGAKAEQRSARPALAAK